MVGIALSCLNLFVLFLVLAPTAERSFRWVQERGRAPVGIWGSSLFLISVFYVPWLNLNPLQHVGLDWLIDVAPPTLELVLKLFRSERFGSLLGFFGILEPLFGPPGWATLFVTARPIVSVLMLSIGTITAVLGMFVAYGLFGKAAGTGLIFFSSLNFLILFYSLPTIDGLGERAFPSLFSLVIPLVGAHIEWGGPLIMIVGLCLLFYAGVRSHAGIDSTIYEREYGED